MLFVGDAQDGFVQRAAVLGAVFGIVRSAKRLWQADPAELLEVERYTGHEPGDAYADLGFRPPEDGLPRLQATSSA
jgi:hypothetical protein